MAIERTLSIVKPDAVSKNHIGEIFARFEKAGLKFQVTARAVGHIASMQPKIDRVAFVTRRFQHGLVHRELSFATGPTVAKDPEPIRPRRADSGCRAFVQD